MDSSSGVRVMETNPCAPVSHDGSGACGSSLQMANGPSAMTVTRVPTADERRHARAMVALATAHLELIAATPETAIAETTGEPQWWRRLGASGPASWPPPLNDADALRWFAESIAIDPEGVGWYTWYVLERDAPAPRRLIGNAGFTGRPDAHGSAEIGYSLLPPHQRQGYGTELVGALIEWAFAHRDVQRVMAETYPDFIASVRVLEKNGFRIAGRAVRPGAIRFELRRTVFLRCGRH